MKLSEEQRKEIKKKVESLLHDDSLGAVGRKYPADYHVELGMKRMELLEEDIPRLLASEQAWRKEAMKWREQAHNEIELSDDIVEEREQLILQLDQAVEVLKWYSDLEFGGQRARDFLSSLSEDKPC